MWENLHEFTHFSHFLSVTKNDLSSENNLLIEMFQLMRMYSYAKNKLQMCSVTQNQFRRHQMWGRFKKNSPSILTFSQLQEMTYLHYSW